ncbi:Uncharacterised protein [[Ruminococcus] torques]|uniref:Uncharacterized protein n=1 Tax=[Ruminococcus] torques TaxID=33039 RepID=A0A6N3D012_9FIRM
MKALYLSTFEIAKKWTMSIRNWGKYKVNWKSCTLTDYAKKYDRKIEIVG